MGYSNILLNISIVKSTFTPTFDVNERLNTALKS